MSKVFSSEVLPKQLATHRAVQAWSRLQPERRNPAGIEILELRHKSSVYRLAGVGPAGSSVIAKMCLRTTACIERMIYQDFLARLPLPALHCFGLVEEPGREFCWLFLEDAAGEIYSPDNPEHRILAGQWLGHLHQAAARSGLQARLSSREPCYYLELLRTSRELLLCHRANPALRAADVKTLETVAAHCDALEGHWSKLANMCGDMPRTLVHGDFVLKNVRVQSGAAARALLVFDWEFSGWGVPATDLVQFAGRAISPDLVAYREKAGGFLAGCDLEQLKRLAECGTFFRMLDDLSWVAGSLEFDSYLCLEKPMSCLRTYAVRWTEAFSKADWIP